MYCLGGQRFTKRKEETLFDLIDARSFGFGFAFKNNEWKKFIHGGPLGAFGCTKSDVDQTCYFRLDASGLKGNCFRIMSTDRRKTLFVGKNGKLSFGFSPNIAQEIWFEDQELFSFFFFY